MRCSDAGIALKDKLALRGAVALLLLSLWTWQI
ncbi:uncharacterized protein PgNI_04204 [Pyricularia grisea]|uniref:Uncharacterized protein n=1 Tax=Pyricularia grisea TaxID=148305 RepID=A0A6P8BF82_PYRGI|nr:uncharacterized protein PgNI_04204 [Pyricularia grisea]TLD14435.1 hypothetical protein PgNI_04204 [Pyricularia grisea]